MLWQQACLRTEGIYSLINRKLDEKFKTWDILPPVGDMVRTFNLRSRHEWGQNFLYDRGLCDRLARILPCLEEGEILEIGAGPGGLTRSLLDYHGVCIVALEKDRRCLELLSSLVDVSQNRLRLVEGDALEKDLSSLVSAPRYLQANLPFGISSPLLISLLQESYAWESWVIMVQKELGERLCSKPHSKSYGRLSVLVQGLCEVESIMVVDSRVFTPMPKVDGLMVKISPKDFLKTGLRGRDWLDGIWRIINDLLRRAFSARRKTLKKSLSGVENFCFDMLEQVGCDVSMRADAVSVDSYWRLAELILDNSFIDKHS